MRGESWMMLSDARLIVPLTFERPSFVEHSQASCIATSFPGSHRSRYCNGAAWGPLNLLASQISIITRLPDIWTSRNNDLNRAQCRCQGIHRTVDGHGEEVDASLEIQLPLFLTIRLSSMTASTLDTAITRRRVRVDDMDTSITYDGPWSVDASGSRDKLGNFGPTFRRSLHGVRMAPASFSFSYEGTSASVFGSLDDSESAGFTGPGWRCFIDGREGTAPDPIPFPQNHQKLCNFGPEDIALGKHTLLVQVANSSRSFWLDHIDYLYSPSPTVAPYVSLTNTDPDIVYDDSWRSLYRDANFTTTPGSTMTVSFNGTGIDWYGMIPTEFDHGSSTSSYSLDGEAPTEFTLKGLDANVSEYNQLFFSSPDRPFGTHNITVTYLGSRTPLVLAYLLIRDSSATTRQNLPSTVAVPFPPPPGMESPASQRSSALKPRAIAGLVAGVLLAVGLIIAGFILGRRLHRRRSDPANIKRTVRTPAVTPFPIERQTIGHCSCTESLTTYATGAGTPVKYSGDVPGASQQQVYPGRHHPQQTFNAAPPSVPPPYIRRNSIHTTLPSYTSLRGSFLSNP